MRPILKDITLAGIITEDLKGTLKIYSERYGVLPWKIFDYKEETVARSRIGKTIWEIVNPKGIGSVYDKFLKKKEEGLAYLGYEVKDLNSTLEYFEKIGCEVIYEGRESFFLDLQDDLKHIAKIYRNTDKKPDEVFGDESKDKIRPFFQEVRQIGFVVKDIKETAATYVDKYGVGGPWNFYKYYSPKIKDMYYHGEEVFSQKFTTSAVIPNIADVEVELIQPEAGPNIYEDHLKESGEGLQHISFIYNKSFDEVLEITKKRGQAVLQQGNLKGAIYAYLDTVADLKFISEPLYVPEGFEMLEPDDKYPK